MNHSRQRPGVQPAKRGQLLSLLLLFALACPSFAQPSNSIPSLFISANPDDLFSTATGIYTHPEQRGSDWERPAVIEWVSTNGIPGFTTHCGIRIHGGTSRDPEQSPKHSFRLHFRNRYGAASLDYPLFGPNEPHHWTTLILRAGHNNSWLHPDAAQRQRADYLRDEWMRRSLRDMGHPSARGTFANVFLNGSYWGLYNLCEDPGSLPAQDSRKAALVKSGDEIVWKQIIALADAGLADDERYHQIAQLLDLPEFTDYLILNLYAGTKDWNHANNWYAIRSREPGAKYQFQVWDAERTLENVNAETLDFDDKESPPGLFHSLIANTQFRSFFETRVRQLFAGPLSPQANTQRYQALVAEVEKAMPLEAARWGSYRHNAQSSIEIYTAENHWRPEIDRILNHYFPQRTAIVLDQFAQAGLYHKD